MKTDLELQEKTALTKKVGVAALVGLSAAILASYGLFALSAYQRGRGPNLSSSRIFRCPTISDLPDPLAKRDADDSELHAALADGTSREISKQVRQLGGKKLPSEVRQALGQLALQRKRELLLTMIDDPAKALSAHLPVQEEQALAATTDNCLERPATVEGTLHISHADLADGSATFSYSLETADGETVFIHATGLTQSLQSGARLRVRGLRLDNHLLVNRRAEADGLSVEMGVDILSSPESVVTGEQKTLIILAYFQNTPMPSTSLNAVYNAFYDPNPQALSVDHYFRENSYGTNWLSGVNNPRQGQGYNGDIYGWYQLPMNANCEEPTVSQAAMTATESALGEAGIDFTRYRHLMILAPFTTCNWGGVAFGSINLQTPDGLVYLSQAWVQASAYGSGVPIHEFAHSLGDNDHASLIDCGTVPVQLSGCTHVEYGDRFDVLSDVTGNRGHLNAPHKEYVGWITPGSGSTHEVRLISTPGITTYDLQPLEAQSPGLKALKIQRAANDYLYVEYRQPLGFDAALNPGNSWNVYQGGLLHIYSPHYSPSPSTPALLNAQASTQQPTDLLLYRAALTPGYSNPDTGQAGFVDPATGTRVRVISTTVDQAHPENSRARVEVTLGTNADFQDPTVTIVPPTPVSGSTVSGTITVATDVQDNFGVADVYFSFSAGSVQQTVHVTQPTSGTLYTASLDTTRIPNGPATIGVQAFDISGRTTFKGVIVVNQNDDSIPPAVQFISPLNNAQVTSPISFSVNAADNVGIWKVAFYEQHRSTPFLVDTTSPFEGTRSVAPGGWLLQARAYDFAGNTTDAAVSLNVLDTTPPVAWIMSPFNGQTITGTITVRVMASDDAGVSFVELFNDAATSPLAFQIPGKPYTDIILDTRRLTNGPHTLYARAVDAAGNSRDSYPPTSVTVSNTSPPPGPPPPAPKPPEVFE